MVDESAKPVAESQSNQDKQIDETLQPKPAERPERSEAREIKGNLPYTASPGSVKSVMDAIVKAERPDKLSNTYMETVFGLSGGGARSVPPILKKMGFLQSDGSPTDLYSKFKTDSGRSQATLTGLKQAFPEIFRKNEVAHRANDDQLRDIIVEITGLKKADPVLRHIQNTFSIIKAYISDNGVNLTSMPNREPETPSAKPNDDGSELIGRIGLAYQINIVLPESQDPVVYDTIFRSLKRNLLT